MASTTKVQSIKSIMAGGVWRSRRVAAAVALTAGFAFGVAGTSVQQAEAGIGWCMRCYPTSVEADQTSAAGIKSMYTVRPSVYASTN
ncbi:MAG TPA: hypothetical protein VGT61_11100 [Thermomicrobiales bacterium]|jgi:hypothetical protein|nr:hypothetical protein [Thermomicrobiales bacterium]